MSTVVELLQRVRGKNMGILIAGRENALRFLSVAEEYRKHTSQNPGYVAEYPEVAELLKRLSVYEFNIRSMLARISKLEADIKEADSVLVLAGIAEEFVALQSYTDFIQRDLSAVCMQLHRKDQSVSGASKDTLN